MSEAALPRLHFALVKGLVEDGICPSNHELALRLGVEEGEGLLFELSEINDVVVYPHVCEPSVRQPF